MTLEQVLPRSPAWDALFRPLLPAMRAALARAGIADFPSFEAGPPSGPWARLEADRVVLRSDLLHDAARTPPDQAWAEAAPEGLGVLALDRWRRAAAAVMEGVVLWRARARPSPWREASAAEEVDRLEPSLGALWPELVDLRTSASPSVAAPRHAAWLVRWAKGAGAALTELNEGHLLAFFTWIRDPARGPASSAPVPIPLAAPELIQPWLAPAWSARVLRVEPGPVGALMRVEGAAAPRPARLAGAEPREILIASVAGGEIRVNAAPLGPIGRWALATGVVQERVGAARGVELELLPDGRVEILLADGFMGLPTAGMLELADSLGVSGWASGRWQVIDAGDGDGDGDEGVLRLDQVRSRGLTVHPRGGHGFAVPASALLGPAERILAALSGAVLRWRHAGQDLTLIGPVSGWMVELRFRAALR